MNRSMAMTYLLMLFLFLCVFATVESRLKIMSPEGLRKEFSK